MDALEHREHSNGALKMHDFGRDQEKPFRPKRRLVSRMDDEALTISLTPPEKLPSIPKAQALSRVVTSAPAHPVRASAYVSAVDSTARITHRSLRFLPGQAVSIPDAHEDVEVKVKRKSRRQTHPRRSKGRFSASVDSFRFAGLTGTSTEVASSSSSLVLSSLGSPPEGSHGAHSNIQSPICVPLPSISSPSVLSWMDRKAKASSNGVVKKRDNAHDQTLKFVARDPRHAALHPSAVDRDPKPSELELSTEFVHDAIYSQVRHLRLKHTMPTLVSYNDGFALTVTVIIHRINQEAAEVTEVELSKFERAQNTRDGYLVGAEEFSKALQATPARIDGPALVFTMQGEHCRAFLQISAEDHEVYGSLVLNITRIKTIQIYVEVVPELGSLLPSTFQGHECVEESRAYPVSIERRRYG